MIIIGGGLIGMLTARYLAQAGVEVSLYEQNAVAQESSWAGGGILSPLFPWRYDDAITELARWGQARYQALASDLLEQTTIDPEYQQSGMLMLGLDDEEYAEAKRWSERFSYHMASIDEAELQALQPKLHAPQGHKLSMPDVAQMRNPRLLKALRKSIETMGVKVFTDSPVEEILIADGGVAGIRIAGSERATKKLVVAGGAWSGELLKPLGVALPVRPVRGQMLLFRAQPGVLSQIVLSGRHYLIPRKDGRILAGSTMEEAGFDKSTTDSAREEFYAFACSLLPALREYPVEKQWSGLRPGTANGIPFIGEIPGISGLYVNAGHFRNGVVIGLASAHLLVDQLLRREPILDPAPYALRT